jgi:phosphogluconate dehydratase
MQHEVLEVTERIVRRSRTHRSGYLRHMDEALAAGPARHRLPASNLAHAMAVCRGTDRERMRDGHSPHIAILTSYNDLVSTHHTFEAYPAILKKAVAAAGGVAQVAAGVPAMCDGITQGEPGIAR